MSQHMWVALQYTPIEVDVQEDGTLHTFTGEFAEEISRDEAALICFICGVTLTTDNHDEECTGDEDSKNIAGDLDKS